MLILLIFNLHFTGNGSLLTFLFFTNGTNKIMQTVFGTKLKIYNQYKTHYYHRNIQLYLYLRFYHRIHVVP